MKPKNTLCLWYDKDAEEAARFYAATFPNSKVTGVHKATTRAARRATSSPSSSRSSASPASA